MKTYTYKLKPNKKLENTLQEWSNITRYVYNLAKEVREESFKKGVSINYYDLSAQLTDAKKEFEWLRRPPSETLQATLERLDKAYQKFFKDLKGGKKTSNPHWARKDKWKSVPFKTVKTTHNGFKLPKIGVVKVFNFKTPKGELRTANIVKEADGWYLKVVVKEEDKNRESQSVCAIDMGIKYFLVTSDGEFIDNPKHLDKYLKQLRIENRKLSRKKKGGSNFKKQGERLARLHQKVSRVRKDFLHKTSSRLANMYSEIIREDLDIQNMLKDSSFARQISDCSWGMFFKMLEYKTSVTKVNPAYTSQMCSSCGSVNKENRKTQSEFKCLSCGFTENADLNASLNIFRLGQQPIGANVGQ